MNLVNTKIKQEFDADGYVAIYSFFEDNKIQEIKNEIDRYIVDIGPTFLIIMFFMKINQTRRQLKIFNKCLPMMITLKN